MKNGIVYNTLVRIVPFIMAGLLKIWFTTCRLTTHGEHHRNQALGAGKAVIATSWHYGIIYVLYHMRKDPGALLVSASKDGEFIARFAKYFNYSTIRGSRHRRGLRALKELMVLLDKGIHIGMVADGSKGPPLVVQSGAIYLASRSGSPILPTAWSCSRYIRFKSWDRTTVPKLFSKIDFFYGEPIFVPPEINTDEIEIYRLKLEEAMKSLYSKAWAVYEKKEH